MEKSVSFHQFRSAVNSAVILFGGMFVLGGVAGSVVPSLGARPITSTFVILLGASLAVWQGVLFYRHYRSPWKEEDHRD